MIVFTVNGQPIPKARPRVGKHSTYTPEKTAAWETAVGWAARMAGAEPLTGDLSVTLLFRRKGIARADLDNLCKSALDGLNGIAFDDDAQIIELSARVAYKSTAPGVTISIEEVK